MPGLRREGTRKLRAPPGVYFTMNGRLELEEALVGEVVARDVVHPRAGHERLLERRAAQVEVAVLEALLLARVDLVLDLERRRLGAVEDLELGRVDLDLAGLESRVHVGAARDDLPADADAVLEPELASEVVHVGPDVLLEHHLGDPRPVAHVDEHRPAVVAPVVHPPEEDDLLADIVLREVTARVGSLELGDETRQWQPPCSGIRQLTSRNLAGQAPLERRRARGRLPAGAALRVLRLLRGRVDFSVTRLEFRQPGDRDAPCTHA